MTPVGARARRPDARVVAAAALVLVGLCAAAGFFLLKDRADPDPAATASAGQPVPSSPTTVVLVPGYGGTPSSVTALAERLRADGHPVAVVTLPGDGTGDIPQMAAELDRVVTAALPTASAVDVVGYSMGGLVARVWARDLGGATVARRIVTVGTPHQGTEAAALAALAGACPPACQQMQPDSELLGRLAAGDPTPAGPAWVSVWSADDETIRPPESSVLEGASNVRLQDGCPGVTVDHGGLVRDAEPLAVLSRAVGSEPWTTPGACLSR